MAQPDKTIDTPGQVCLIRMELELEVIKSRKDGKTKCSLVSTLVGTPLNFGESQASLSFNATDMCCCNDKGIIPHSIK